MVDPYKVLGLPARSLTTTESSPAEIKAAYRKALLVHHPDKSALKNELSTPSGRFTVDEINEAYTTLSDPKAKLQYDRLRRLEASKAHSDTGKDHAGLETIDLDDLCYDEDSGLWHRGCRCGKLRGFELSEADLEGEVEHGEIILGCDGCSLWLRVTFQVAEGT